MENSERKIHLHWKGGVSAAITGDKISDWTSEDCSRTEIKDWARDPARGPKDHPSVCPSLRHPNLPQSHQEAGRGIK